MPTDPLDNRLGLLQAIAEGGTRAAEGYRQAQAQLVAQQQAATQGALAGSVPLSAGQQAAASGIVASGYAPRQASLTQGAAISQDYFNKLGANTGAYLDKTAAVLPLLEAQLAAKMSGGGGGGSGGGGKGGSTGDSFLDLKKQFGTEGALKDFILGESNARYGTEQNVGKYRASGVATELGVPSNIATQWFPRAGESFTSFAKGETDLANPAVRTSVYKRNLRQVAHQYPGNQSGAIAPLVATYSTAKQATKKKKK